MSSPSSDIGLGPVCGPQAIGSTARRVQRSLMVLPEYATLVPEDRAAIERLDASCRRLAAVGTAARRGPDFDARCTHVLQDELSRMATARNGMPAWDPGRTASEAAAAERHCASLDKCRDPRAFARWMLRIAADAGVREPRLRQTDITLDADGDGVLVAFPPATAIPSRIVEMLVSRTTLDGPPCYTAIALAAALLNLHPLRDGNGRSARVLLNVLLRAGYPGLARYLPIYDLRAHAPFAFEIALRAAELHGEWRRLADLLSTLIDLIIDGDAPQPTTRAYPVAVDQLRIAAEQGVPVFLDGDVPASSPMRGAPFRVDDANLRALFATSPARRRLVDALLETRTELARHAHVQAVLVGGSLVRPAVEVPRDVDAVFFYSLPADAEPASAIAAMARVAASARGRGVDLRLVPTDADPVDLIKAACYFALLFASERGGPLAHSGSLLLADA